MEESGQYVYKECRKNYAAPLGGHAVDGCGEFVAGDPELWCAACGCHRSFHLKVLLGPQQAPPPPQALVTAGRKRRARTKFSEEQKERMQEFAERIGWRMARGRASEEEVVGFLEGTGVSERAFRIWMHNHRHAPCVGGPGRAGPGASQYSSSAESGEGACGGGGGGNENNGSGNIREF